MKKIVYLFLVLIVGFYSLSFAYNEFSYENAKNLANDYIKNSSFDENWKDKNPTIAGEGKYFYTDSEDPSYVEFKVSCDNNPDCGFIMVNFDGDDVSIPISSTSGNTPSEVLAAKNGNNVKDNKLYYFNPFEQYAENKITGDVSSVDPQDDSISESSGSGDINQERKYNKKTRNKFLKDKIKSEINEVVKYKKSNDFKENIKELRSKKQINGKKEVSYKILPFANADTPPLNNGGYSPITASDTYVPGNSTTNCGSRIPCYNQYTSIYNGKTAWSGCYPTAVAMIYGYYDRQGTFPNLVSGTAIDSSNSSTPDENVKSMIDSLRTYMGTYYTYDSNKGIYEGTTMKTNVPLSIQYAKSKGYNNSTATYTSGNSSSLFPTIKSEINAGRPVVLLTDNHSIVAYGYNSTIKTANIIRANLGWGANSTINGLDNKVYYTSNIDYNMDYIYYNKSNHPTQGIVTFKLAN